jgi:hypothetical protein
VHYRAGQRTYKMRVASNYKHSKQVRLLYLPNRPSSAIVGSRESLFIVPAVLGGFGLLLVAGAGLSNHYATRDESELDV